MQRNPMNPRPAVLLAVVVVMVAALVAGACGGAQNDAGTGTSLSPSTTASGTTAAPAPAGVGTTGTPTTTAAPPELTEVDVIMDWAPWVLDIPIDVAQAKGFYAGRGLSVHQTLPAGPTDVPKFVSTGKSQFGLYYAPDTLMAVEAGAPLVSIGSLMSHAPVGMALKPGLAADSPAVLSGQVVSVPLIPSTRASFASMLSTAGVDPAGVNIVDPGFELVAPLLQGKVTAAAFTEFGELVAAEAQGQELTYLDFRDWGTPDFAFLNVITTQEFAEANPDTTRAFLAATIEGLTYSAAHPEEAVSLYTKAHPELDPQLLLAQWKAAIPHLALDAGKPAGWQDVEAWGALNSWMKAVGLLRETQDVALGVTNDFVEVDK
jgi:ABC-type nitrate/sulfonate/bicarbonate transport system substrate-binding protein